jgi:UDP-2-acetamido-3-amino-2,3-dideoxy-glucuronate N-acetyltransferase
MGAYSNMIHEPVQLHHTVLIGNGCEIWPFATLLEGVELGDGVVVGTCTFLGRRCRIGAGTRIHPGAAIPDNAVIGARVFIGANVVLTDVSIPELRDKHLEVHRPPIIEDDVVLGSNAVILPGVIVHRGAVVGAGSVVSRDVPPHCIVMGNPARVTRYATPSLGLNEAGEIVSHG